MRNALCSRMGRSVTGALWAILASACCLVSTTVVATAQETGPQPRPSPSPSASPAVLIGGHYVGEFAANSTGFATGSAYASEFMVQGTFDLAQLLAPNLGRVHVILTAREGSSLSADTIGNIFTVQEIYGDGLTPRLTEFSYDQPFARGKADLYAGRINTENDFAASSVYWGGVALYCSYQNNAICGTPIAAPIDSGYVAYPSSSWGARLKAYPMPNLYLEAGAYEVNPTIGLRGNGFKLSTAGDTGTFLPVELGVTFKDGAGNFAGTFKAGGYYDTSLAPTAQSQMTRFFPSESPTLAFVPSTTYRGRFGFWTIADHIISGSAAKHKRGIAAFGALQYGDPQTSLLSFFADGGVVAHGTFAGRDDDTVSLGFAYTNVNPRIRDEEQTLLSYGFPAPLNGQEKILELNYGALAAPGVILRPGIQYVINPSGERAIPNALVFDLQGVATF